MLFRPALILAALLLSGPALAQNSAQEIQGNQAAPQRGPMKQGPEMRTQSIEERINMLHEAFGITKEQDPAWSAVAQVMKENDAKIMAAIKERRKQAGNMSAVDSLKTIEALTEDHLEGMRKMIPVFQALYNEMSPAQKQVADKTFGHFEGRKGHSSDMKNQ